MPLTIKPKQNCRWDLVSLGEVKMEPHHDLFNPAYYAGVRKPLLEAETVPAWCYTSQEFYQREVERIWRKLWNFVGSADQMEYARSPFGSRVIHKPSYIFVSSVCEIAVEITVEKTRFSAHRLRGR